MKKGIKYYKVGEKVEKGDLLFMKSHPPKKIGKNGFTGKNFGILCKALGIKW